MPDKLTRKEWRACGLLLKLGAGIITGGIVFNLTDFFFELNDIRILIVAIGLVGIGVVVLMAGVICKFLWKRRYTR